MNLGLAIFSWGFILLVAASSGQYNSESSPYNFNYNNITYIENSITWDFEKGGLLGWTQTGDAFDNALAALGPEHAGRMQIDTQGIHWIRSDNESKGTLTSQPFVINGNKISFLRGGSRFDLNSGKEKGCYVALIINDMCVKFDDGDNNLERNRTEWSRRDSQSKSTKVGNDSLSMKRIEWNVSTYRGKTAELQLVDDSSRGYISFDDVRFDVPPSMAKRFTVHKGDSIQNAINSANIGDIIEVNSGTYTENLNINKKLNLYGVDIGAGNPIIDARNLGSAITISTDGVDLGWFHVTNSSFNAGIKVDSSWNGIHDIIASNSYVGILLSQSTHNTISSIKIMGIINSSAYGGLVLENSSFNLIRMITISASDVGISMRNSNNNEINSGTHMGYFFSYDEENSISENKIGIRLFNSNDNLFTANHVSNNEIGVLLSNSFGNILKGNYLLANNATAYDDGNNQWSSNCYGVREGLFEYHIPGGLNVDIWAHGCTGISMPAKMDKGARKMREK